MAADAIQGYLACLQEDGLPIPPSDQPLVEAIRDRVTVKLPAE